MNDGNKRRSSAELIPLIFSAVLLDIIPIHYCHNLYSVMYSVKSVLHFPRSSLRRLRDEAAVNAVLFRSPSCYPARSLPRRTALISALPRFTVKLKARSCKHSHNKGSYQPNR